LDSLYTFQNSKAGTSLDAENGQIAMDKALERIKALEKKFKDVTGYDINSKEGIELLKRDNNIAISNNPQPRFENKYFCIN
jgi:hypothetical protein